jgi:hypothetical protein
MSLVTTLYSLISFAREAVLNYKFVRVIIDKLKNVKNKLRCMCESEFAFKHLPNLCSIPFFRNNRRHFYVVFDFTTEKRSDDIKEIKPDSNSSNICSLYKKSEDWPSSDSDVKEIRIFHYQSDILNDSQPAVYFTFTDKNKQEEHFENSIKFIKRLRAKVAIFDHKLEPEQRDRLKEVNVIIISTRTKGTIKLFVKEFFTFYSNGINVKNSFLMSYGNLLKTKEIFLYEECTGNKVIYERHNKKIFLTSLPTNKELYSDHDIFFIANKHKEIKNMLRMLLNEKASLFTGNDCKDCYLVVSLLETGSRLSNSFKKEYRCAYMNGIAIIQFYWFGQYLLSEDQKKYKDILEKYCKKDFDKNVLKGYRKQYFGKNVPKDCFKQDFENELNLTDSAMKSIYVEVDFEEFKKNKFINPIMKNGVDK